MIPCALQPNEHDKTFKTSAVPFSPCTKSWVVLWVMRDTIWKRKSLALISKYLLRFVCMQNSNTCSYNIGYDKLIWSCLKQSPLMKELSKFHKKSPVHTKQWACVPSHCMCIHLAMEMGLFVLSNVAYKWSDRSTFLATNILYMCSHYPLHWGDSAVHLCQYLFRNLHGSHFSVARG